MLVVGETEAEAKRRKEQLLTAIPREAAGAFISHNAGYDFSKLPARFTLSELNKEIARRTRRRSASSTSWHCSSAKTPRSTREEFFEHGMKIATGYDHTRRRHRASKVADHSRRGVRGDRQPRRLHDRAPAVKPRDLLNVVDFLVPELQRRGRFRTEYEGTTLKDNLRIAA